MKNKQVKIIVSVILLLTIVVCTYNNFLNKNEEIVLNKKTETKTGTTSLSMMYETEAGSGNYEESNESSWPSEGYTFNETLSKCEQGGTLSWNEEEHKVYLSTNKSDKCYVYFDKYSKPVITSVSGISDTNYKTTFTINATGSNLVKYIYKLELFTCSGEMPDLLPPSEGEFASNVFLYDTPNRCYYNGILTVIAVDSLGNQSEPYEYNYLWKNQPSSKSCEPC